MHRTILILGTVLTILASCGSKVEAPEVTSQAPNEEALIGVNRDIVRNEGTDIRLLIRRYGWNMQVSESGVYYEIVRKGNGPLLKKGDAVQLKYTLTLLDGTMIGSSEKDGLKTVVIERSDETVGLQEALKLMHRGDKARLIIPSHLAYGSLGDGDRIPGFAPLVYVLEIL